MAIEILVPGRVELYRRWWRGRCFDCQCEVRCHMDDGEHLKVPGKKTDSGVVIVKCPMEGCAQRIACYEDK